jgi:branched-chain amino acid transport system ATP-binding protein
LLPDAGPILELKDVHSSYGSVKVLQGVNAEINPGELVVFLGSNASGKTTMLKTILGRVPTVSGEIRFMGKRIDGMPTSEIARAGIAIVPEGRRIFPQLTVLENLELGGYMLRDRRLAAERIDSALELFPRLAERRNQVAGTLSGGEQQMLAISRALMADPELILMDEPSMGLAPVLVERVMDAISDINRRGMTVLLVEQNAQAALAVADRVYILRSGRVVAQGPASDFIEGDTIAKAYLE